MQLLPNRDHHFCPDYRLRGRQIGHPDSKPEAGRERPAREFAEFGFPIRCKHGVSVPQRRRFFVETDRDKPCRQAGLALRYKSITSDKGARFFEFYEKAEPGLERSVDFVEVRSIEGKSFFEP